MSAEVRLHSEGCRESIRQAMVDEDMGQQRARANDLWSQTLRWDVQSAGSQPGDRRRTLTHETVRDMTLQEATESTKDRERRRGTRRSGRVH